MKIINLSLLLSLSVISINGNEKEINKTNFGDLPPEIIGKMKDNLNGKTNLNSLNKDVRKKFFEAKARSTDKGFIVKLGRKGNKFNKDNDFKSSKVNIKVDKNYKLDEFVSQLSDFMKYYGKKVDNISVDISNVDLSNLKDNEISTISKSLKNVKELDLTNTGITPSLLVTLFKESNSLENLDLTSVDLSQLTVEQAELISKSLKNVKGLRLYETKIKVSSLVTLLEGFTSLENLNIYNVNLSSLTVEQAKRFAKSLSNIRNIDLIRTKINNDTLNLLDEYLPEGAEIGDLN